MSEIMSLYTLGSNPERTATDIRLIYGDLDKTITLNNESLSNLFYHLTKMSKDRNILSMISPSVCNLYFDPKDSRKVKQGVQEILLCMGLNIKL